MRARLFLTFALAAAVTAAAAGPANARKYGDARFTATISGTYDVSGSVTNTGCWRADDSDNAVTFSASGQAQEHAAFRSTRGMLLGVSRMRGEKRLFAGGPAIPVAATISRSGNLTSSTEPDGCKPNEEPARCGTKSRAYKLAIYGVRSGFGLSYNFSSGYSTKFPDDPFYPDCALPEGSDWWGGYYSRGNGTAPVSVAKLLNPRVKKIVVHGALSAAPTSSGGDYSAHATESLNWTLTLKRRH